MHCITRRGALVLGAGSLAAVTGSTARRELFVVGDSWAAGLHADPAHALGQVASAQLGWTAAVDAVSGTGYVNGIAEHRSYPDRLRSLRVDPDVDVVVLQGGSNDRAAPADDVFRAACEAVALVRLRLPAARPVMLGPGPDPMPVTPEQLEVDRVLRLVARRQRVPYVSMLRQGWITDRSAPAVLDPRNHHPTPEGQVYLGRRLASALRGLFPRLTG